MTVAALLVLAGCGSGDEGGGAQAPASAGQPAQSSGGAAAGPTGDAGQIPDEPPLPAASGAPDVADGPQWNMLFSGTPISSLDGFVGVVGAGVLDSPTLSLRRVSESGEEVWRKELSAVRVATPGASSADQPQGVLTGGMRDGARSLVAVAVTEPGTASGITQTSTTTRLVGFDAGTGDQTWGAIAGPQVASGEQSSWFGDGVLVKSGSDYGTVYSTRDGQRLWDGAVRDSYSGSVVPDVLRGVSGTTGLVTRRSATRPYAPDLDARELPGGRVLWRGADLTPPAGATGRPVLAKAGQGYAALVWRDVDGRHTGLSVVEVATGQTVGALQGSPGGSRDDDFEDQDENAVTLWLDRSTNTVFVGAPQTFGVLDVAGRRVLWQRTVGQGGTTGFKLANVGGGLLYGTGATPVVLDARTGEVRASGQFGFPVAVSQGGVALYPSEEGEGTYVAYRRRG